MSLEHSLYVFGTGNASVTRYYNTCFAIRTGSEFFMVDAGGGNGILSILEDMSVPICRIHHMFISHEHTDHILGAVWMIRMIASAIKKGTYQSPFFIYCHDGLTETIRTLCRLTLQKKFCDLLGKEILLIPVSDGETKTILDMEVTFFDIHSIKARQFAFRCVLPDGKRICFAGDEPLQDRCAEYAAQSSWLFHEAFCLYRDREQFRPYEKHHSTVRDACELAESLHVSNLLLWHTEDRTFPNRNELYSREGSLYFHGSLFIPRDRDILQL